FDHVSTAQNYPSPHKPYTPAKTAKTELKHWRSREAQLYLMIVNYLIELQDYPGATRAMQTLLRIHPDDVNVLAGMGRLYLQLGNIDAANQTFRQVEATIDRWEHEVEPEVQGAVDAEGIKAARETVVMNRAFTAMAAGNWEQAKSILVQALERNSENLVVSGVVSLVKKLYWDQLCDEHSR
ncbi:hypothetical protein BC938DRAFT_481131, partial [Jimgerdemannia flammicorona]